MAVHIAKTMELSWKFPRVAHIGREAADLEGHGCCHNASVKIHHRRSATMNLPIHFATGNSKADVATVYPTPRIHSHHFDRYGRATASAVSFAAFYFVFDSIVVVVAAAAPLIFVAVAAVVFPSPSPFAFVAAFAAAAEELVWAEVAVFDPA